ncbi:hypothetical protein CDD83_1014 [Cordyceps sp. RAO-2017]|nr:hypothetical protein CDD83_1014 [Cordyceps sp. RAO-2017]
MYLRYYPCMYLSSSAADAAAAAALGPVSQGLHPPPPPPKAGVKIFAAVRVLCVRRETVAGNQATPTPPGKQMRPVLLVLTTILTINHTSPSTILTINHPQSAPSVNHPPQSPVVPEPSSRPVPLPLHLPLSG